MKLAPAAPKPHCFSTKTRRRANAVFILKTGLFYSPWVNTQFPRLKQMRYSGRNPCNFSNLRPASSPRSVCENSADRCGEDGDLAIRQRMAAFREPQVCNLPRGPFCKTLGRARMMFSVVQRSPLYRHE